jgi:hypothetical protein
MPKSKLLITVAVLAATIALDASAQTGQWYNLLDDTGSGPGRCVTFAQFNADLLRTTGIPAPPGAENIRTPDDFIMYERYHGDQAYDVTWKYSHLASLVAEVGPGQTRVVHVAGFPHDLMFINDLATCEIFQATIYRGKRSCQIERSPGCPESRLPMK